MPCSTPCCPTTGRTSCITSSAPRGSKLLFTPDEFRGFDHASLGAELVHDIEALRGNVVVRGSGDFWQRVFGREPTRFLPPTDPAALSEVIFTSGTEATPKGVMHTEHTTNCNVRSAYAVNDLGPDDVVWAPSPIGHSTGLNFGVRLALYFGLKLVLQDAWNADRAVELIERERCSYTLAATTFLTDLIAAAARSGRDVSSLTRFGCGGAPVPPEVVRAGADADINVLRIYGLTEALVVSWNRPSSSLEQRMHSDGVALPEVELAIWDDADTPVPAGTQGEIVVRGPNVCVGLFDDPEREQRIFTERRLAAHRGRRRARRRRLPRDRRPHEGDHHPRRDQHRAARDRRPHHGDARRACGRSGRCPGRPAG